MAIAPEQCLRVLHAIDTDLDDIITLEDFQAYVHRHSLPVGVEEMAAMFAEANVSHDGKMDIDQLTKAASGKFPHRAHNEAWRRLFAAAPNPRAFGASDAPVRLTELLEPLPQQSAIRASYEQESAVLTYQPDTSASQLSLSSTASRKTLTFPGGGSTAPTQAIRSLAGAPALQPFASSRLGPGENADETRINQSLRPVATEADAASTASAASADKPLRCGWDARAAFEARVARTRHASDAEGWRGRLPVPRSPAPSPLHYGVHPREFTNVTTLQNGKLPLRVDGAMRQGKFGAPLRLFSTENSGVGGQNSRAHRAWAMPSPGAASAISAQEFLSVFKRRSIQAEKMAVATDRLAQARGAPPCTPLHPPSPPPTSLARAPTASHHLPSTCPRGRGLRSLRFRAMCSFLR